MLKYGGATGPFPVIASDRDPAATAAWLATALGDRVAPPIVAANDANVPSGTVTEYPMPEPRDRPHDVAVDASGRVVVTGMLRSAPMAAHGPAPLRHRHAWRALGAGVRGQRARTEGLPGRVTRASRASRSPCPTRCRTSCASIARVWVGTGAPDALLGYDPATRRWETIPLVRGAMVRHMAIDPAMRAVWLAYGASPGIAARVARVTPAVPATRTSGSAR